MKIVCGSCQAKYSIADEKVAGKVFRIRCKRCGEVIVVRGDQDSPEAAVAAADRSSLAAPAPVAADTPTDAIWHVVINGEQAGPYSPAQLGQLVVSGQLDWEAYVWSEGFDNWQPMRDVPELVSAISGEQAVPVAMGQPAPQVANSQMGEDPFPEEAPRQQVAVFAKAAGGGGGGGVVETSSRADTGASALAGFDSAASPVVSSAPSPRVTTQQAMTGARNENSVLFSLKNLQALATGSAPPSGGSASVRPGHANGEGSGLIDIRALATTTGVSDSNRHSEKDALLALGSAQGGAFGTLGSPMLAPVSQPEEGANKKTLVMAILGGFALLAVAGVAVAYILKDGSSTPAEATPIAPAGSETQPAAANAANAAPGAQGEAPVAPPAEQAQEELSEGELAARQAAKAAEQEPAEAPAEDHKQASSSSRSSSSNSRRTGSSSDKTPAPAAVSAKEAEPSKPAEKPKSSANASIDDLLNSAIGGKSNSLGAKSSAAANLPDKPSRDDVLKAMKSVTDAVKACGHGQAGVAFANVTVIGKTGMVGSADVTGVTGDTASCITKAVRRARFPKFSSENFQVKFPFRL